MMIDSCLALSSCEPNQSCLFPKNYVKDRLLPSWSHVRAPSRNMFISQGLFFIKSHLSSKWTFAKLNDIIALYIQIILLYISLRNTSTCLESVVLNIYCLYTLLVQMALSECIATQHLKRISQIIFLYEQNLCISQYTSDRKFITQSNIMKPSLKYLSPETATVIYMTWRYRYIYIGVTFAVSVMILWIYRPISNIRSNVEGNKIVDQSDVVGASRVGAA